MMNKVLTHEPGHWKIQWHPDGDPGEPGHKGGTFMSDVSEENWYHNEYQINKLKEIHNKPN